jgi:hypothetical protein
VSADPVRKRLQGVCVVFQSLADAARGVLEPTLGYFRDTGFAYGVAGSMALTALVLVTIAVVVHILRMSALQARIISISSIVSYGGGEERANNADSNEGAFASRFKEIDNRLRSAGPLSAPLAHAWNRYRKTLSFTGAPPIMSSQRPNLFFSSAMPPPTWLGFAANLMIAVGLLATFLGLVAALNFAAEGMRADNAEAMQAALRDLLSAASSKFVTSVTGVGLSIVLRLTERLLSVSLRSRIERLSEALEFGIRVDSEARAAAIAGQISRLLRRLDGDAPQVDSR